MTVSSHSSSEALGKRLLGALVGAAELLTVELGRELGLYRALRGRALTAGELAETAGIDRRYAREWLEQRAAARTRPAGRIARGGERLGSAGVTDEALAAIDSALKRLAG
jgi:hypothetical protein